MARLTQTRIREYLDLQERRRSLQRQADDLGKQAKEIEAELLDHVREKSGPDRTLLTCGYVLAVKTRAGSVSWKQEFVRVAGPEEAERIAAAVPRSEYLSVEPKAA